MVEIRPCDRCGKLRHYHGRNHNFCIQCRSKQHVPFVVPGDWIDDALCAKSANPDAWYSSSEELMAYAMDHCAACPVRQECRDYALTVVETEGIWGMTTAEQRRAARRGNAA